MAKRTSNNTASGSTRTIASIENGTDNFPDPFESSGPDVRSFKPSSGATESEGTISEPQDGAISPLELIDGGTAGDGFRGSGRRRGRPPGSRNSQKQAPQNLMEHIESLLLSVHLMGATILSTPEIALDPSEAKAYADALRKVAEFYPMVVDPKKIAIANLCIVMGGIYGTRAVAIYKKSQQPKKGPASVQPIRETQKPEPPKQPAPAPAATIMVPSQVDGSGVDDISVI